MEPFWEVTSGATLAQGDLLSDCLVPLIAPGFGADEGRAEILVAEGNRLIVVTQSCDLENKKARFVATCPIHTLSEFEEANPAFRRKGQWEQVRKGRVEGLHLLASPERPEQSREALVVDFGHIISLPLDYLESHAGSLGDRWRLRSPYLEHYSQAFARFFMRVGLPSAIPPFP
jgi:hypothetical protein